LGAEIVDELKQYSERYRRRREARPERLRQHEPRLHSSQPRHQDLSEEEQKLAVEKNYPMFSRPMNHQEFLAELSGGKKSARSRGYTA